MNVVGKMTSELSLAWQRLQDNPAAEFLVLPDRTMRRGDIAGLVSRLTVRFDAAGMEEGDRLLIRTKDEGAAVACFIACLLDGLVPVMIAPETPDERTKHIADITEASLVILDEQNPCAVLASTYQVLFVSDVTPARQGLRLRKRSAQDVFAARLGLPGGQRAPRLPDAPDGLAYIIFTSGTTSDPAGVMINRHALTANVATIAKVLEIDEKSRVFNDMILAHADGMVQGPIMALLTGCAVVRAGGFAVDRIEDWLNRVRATHATHFLTVPTIWTLIDRYCKHNDYFDAPEFRCLGTVAAAMPQELWERIEARFRQPLINQYGLTETVASALYAGKPGITGAPFTVGVPVDCDARIASVEGSDEGELMLRGPQIFDGYWKNPKRTKDTLTADGWLRTGDLAAQRDDGSYEIRGRIKTAIMSAGFLIRPEEIDDVLNRHPEVQEVVTVGLPHADFGEIAVSAFIGAETLTEDALRAFAQTHLENLKVPKRIIRVDTIPRGDAGKPKLDAVRKMLSDRVEAARPASDTSAGGIEDRLLEVAAGIFFVAPDDLSLSSDPDSVDGWDSFSHIALILAIEEAFGIRLPPNRAAALRSLGDAATAIRDAAG